MSLFRRRGIICHTKTSETICLYQKNQIVSVRHDRQSGGVHDSPTFSSGRRLIFQRPDDLRDATSVRGMDLVIPLVQITEIVSEDSAFSFSAFIQLLTMLPNLRSLHIQQTNDWDKTALSREERRALVLVSKTNRIQHLTIAGITVDQGLQPLISMCRRLQSLRCRVLEKIELGLIMAYLLENYEKYQYHLLSIRYSCVNEAFIDRVRQWIARRPDFPYSITFSGNEFQIWC